MSMDKSKRVAVIALSHNNVEITRKFLESLFSHTQNFDLIMIDNGSKDNTVDYLEKKEYVNGNEREMVLVYNEENLGVIGGRNQGYALYNTLIDKPQYICFLDNDQFVRSGWLDQYFEFIENTKSDLVGVDAWLLNRDFKPVYNCKNPSDAFSYVGCGGMMLKSEVARSLEIDGNLFDPIFNPAYFEDPDLNFRARLAGFAVGWNLQAKIFHLPHQTLGKSKDRLRYFFESHKKFKSKWSNYSLPAMRQTFKYETNNC